MCRIIAQSAFEPWKDANKTVNEVSLNIAFTSGKLTSAHSSLVSYKNKH